MLWEAVDLLQPLLAVGTLLEGDFRWMCAFLLPLGAFAAWGAQSGRCLCAGLTCGSTCSSFNNTAWCSGQASCRPQGPVARTILGGVPAALPGRGGPGALV